MHSSLIGAAGVYFVAARLNARGFNCAPTFGNVPSVDILVSNIDGSLLLSLQVKTTIFGLRHRGRGEDKRPHHYEWDIGWKSALLNKPSLFFALVDLKDFSELPDVFVVPSNIIAGYFAAGPEGWPRARYHETVEKLDAYKNNWDLIDHLLTPEKITISTQD